MTNKEIMQASLLDILFENRNKDYGAYALRKEYDHRLLKALGAAMSVVLLFALLSMTGKQQSTASTINTNPGMEIRTIVLPADNQKEPEPQKKQEIVKQKKPAKQAQIKFTSKIDIKKDNEAKDLMPPVENIAGKITSTQNVPGVPDDGKLKAAETMVPGGNETGKTGPEEPRQPDFIIDERDPEFPGGAAALKKYLARNLGTPEELAGGEKKTVKVRFKVDKDGSVNTFEIVTSGGTEFDMEVMRVCKKMPKWIPAVQNGHNVPVSYILPVTFIGPE